MATAQVGRRRWRVFPVDVTHEVSGFELLFDVVTAFAFSQIEREVLATPTGLGALRAVVILALLWGCWMNYCWVANSVRADAGAVRVLHSLALGGMVVSGMTVAESFTTPGLNGRVVVFLGGYLCIRASSAGSLWLAQGAAARGRVLTVLAAAAWTGATIAVSTQVSGVARPWCWCLALAGEVVAAAAFTRRWRVTSTEHLAARYGFIISVGLEMSLGGIALSVFGYPVTVRLIVLIGAALTIAILLWWLYFDTLHLYARHKVKDAKDRDHERQHAKLAYLHYSLLHVLLLAGMIGFGLAVRRIALTVISPSSPQWGTPLSGLWATALIGGLALYLTTIGLMWWMLDDSVHISNFVIAGGAVAALPFVGHLPELYVLSGAAVLGLTLIGLHVILPHSRTHRHQIRNLLKHGAHAVHGPHGSHGRAHEAAMLSSSPRRLPERVRVGHQRAEVLRCEERRWRWRTPAVQAARAFPHPWLPQGVVDNAVQVRVVLGEVTRRVPEIPEEVRSDVVPAKPPHVPAGVGRQPRQANA
jgi:low temperature requirement protein LtrA